MIINRFGLHWAPGDIAFLVQRSGTTNMISAGLASPFSLKVRKTDTCPHNISIEDFVPVPDWVSDPLAQALFPTPRVFGEKHRIIYDPDGSITDIVSQLSRMSSPSTTIILPIWFRMVDQLKRHYALTNLTPIILTAAEMVHTKDVYRHMAMATAHNRRLLIVARQRLPIFHDIEWITTTLGDLSDQPLEAIGASILREEMIRARPTPEG